MCEFGHCGLRLFVRPLQRSGAHGTLMALVSWSYQATSNKHMTAGWSGRFSPRWRVINGLNDSFVICVGDRELDIGSSDRFLKVLQPAFHLANVIIDLSTVEYMDSTCLGKLVVMRNARAALGLAAPRVIVTHPQLRRIFGVVQFAKMLPLFDDIESAKSNASPQR